jgi:hypothetical protein
MKAVARNPHEGYSGDCFSSFQPPWKMGGDQVLKLSPHSQEASIVNSLLFITTGTTPDSQLDNGFLFLAWIALMIAFLIVAALIADHASGLYALASNRLQNRQSQRRRRRQAFAHGRARSRVAQQRPIALQPRNTACTLSRFLQHSR